MKSKIAYCISFLVITTFSCVEVFDIKNLEYENFLIVEATITDEFKKHQIKLSRTFQIDSLGPRNELNANVYIIDNNLNTYNFKEKGEGIYESENSFVATANKEYTLKITTSNGNSYSSDVQKLTATTQIDNINTVVEINQLDEQIINISLNSLNTKNDANYYRYEYEETYKIIAPYYSNLECNIVSEISPQVEVVSRSESVKNCYKTQYSNKIIQTETQSLSEDNILNFTIREIPIRDFIITNRYSILIKQYVQNVVAYEYYNTLNNFSSNDSYFSQIQAGFLQGNLSSETKEDEKVIGFFEVSSVSEKRTFFNREEFTPLIPDYVDPCYFIAPVLADPSGSPLIMALKNGYIFHDYNDNTIDGLDIGPYILVKKVCGDCTELGVTTKPDFWID